MKTLWKKFESSSIYWRIVIRPNWGKALILLGLMVGGAFFEAMTIGLAVPVLGIATNTEAVDQNVITQWLAASLRFMKVSEDKDFLIFAFIVLACFLFSMRSVFVIIQQYSLDMLAHRVYRKTKTLLLECTLGSPYEDISRQSRGVLLTNVTYPADSVLSCFLGIGTLVTNIVNCLAMLGLMLFLSWWAALIIGFFGVVGLFWGGKILPRFSAVSGALLHELKKHQSKLEIDAIDGIKITKANCLESIIVCQQRELLKKEKKPRREIVLFRNIPVLTTEIIGALLIVGLCVLAFTQPAAGITFPGLVALLLAMRRASPVLSSITAICVGLGRYRSGLEVLEDFQLHRPQEKMGDVCPEKIKEIRFKDVSFYYQSNPKHVVLKGVNFNMEKDSITAIVGLSGSGKSTIADMIIRLFDPTSGSISINGIELQNLYLPAWRNRISYVGQDAFLFNATLRENITLWRESVPDREIEDAVSLAQVKEFLPALPHGYETVVGDRGLKLSGGQCQRVSIARAFLRCPEIIIFDEATSGLDSSNEKIIYDAINVLRKGAIVIVIAHRLGTIKDADQILVLDGGEVAERGTYDSLLAESGVFAKLYANEEVHWSQTETETGTL